MVSHIMALARLGPVAFRLLGDGVLILASLLAPGKSNYVFLAPAGFEDELAAFFKENLLLGGKPMVSSQRTGLKILGIRVHVGKRGLCLFAHIRDVCVSKNERLVADFAADKSNGQWFSITKAISCYHVCLSRFRYGGPLISLQWVDAKERLALRWINLLDQLRSLFCAPECLDWADIHAALQLPSVERVFFAAQIDLFMWIGRSLGSHPLDTKMHLGLLAAKRAFPETFAILVELLEWRAPALGDAQPVAAGNNPFEPIEFDFPFWEHDLVRVNFKDFLTCSSFDAAGFVESPGLAQVRERRSYARNKLLHAVEGANGCAIVIFVDGGHKNGKAGAACAVFFIFFLDSDGELRKRHLWTHTTVAPGRSDSWLEEGQAAWMAADGLARNAPLVPVAKVVAPSSRATQNVDGSRESPSAGRAIPRTLVDVGTENPPPASPFSTGSEGALQDALVFCTVAVIFQDCAGWVTLANNRKKRARPRWPISGRFQQRLHSARVHANLPLGKRLRFLYAYYPGHVWEVAPGELLDLGPAHGASLDALVALECVVEAKRLQLHLWEGCSAVELAVKLREWAADLKPGRRVPAMQIEVLRALSDDEWYALGKTAESAIDAAKDPHGHRLCDDCCTAAIDAEDSSCEFVERRIPPWSIKAWAMLFSADSAQELEALLANAWETNPSNQLRVPATVFTNHKLVNELVWSLLFNCPLADSCGGACGCAGCVHPPTLLHLAKAAGALGADPGSVPNQKPATLPNGKLKTLLLELPPIFRSARFVWNGLPQLSSRVVFTLARDRTNDLAQAVAPLFERWRGVVEVLADKTVRNFPEKTFNRMVKNFEAEAAGTSWKNYVTETVLSQVDLEGGEVLARHLDSVGEDDDD
jgi:hypothetical protein